jgi:peptide/nickel transport system permease protein
MTDLALAPPRSERSLARRATLRRLLGSPTFVVGALILGFWVLCAVFGDRIAPDDPLAQSANVLAPPGSGHLFGTDQLGRDVFSRVLTGSRDLLIVAPLATLLGTVLGTIVGLTMGYFRGIVDDVAGRFVEAFLALPVVVTAIIASYGLGRSNLELIIVIGLLFTPLIARTVRAAVLLERELDYVSAAKLRDEGSLYIMFVEILPNVLQPILVEFTVRVGYAIFAVATLSFLGFGIQQPQPDWGGDISVNYGLITAGYWWETLFPALAIASLVVAVNLVADSISGVLEG